MSEALLRDLGEAAGALRISESRVRQEVAAGRLGHVRLGRRLLFRDEDLRTFIERYVVVLRQTPSGGQVVDRSALIPHLPTSRRPCRTRQRCAIVRARRRRWGRRREPASGGTGARSRDAETCFGLRSDVLYWIGWLAVAGLLVYEHSLVSATDLSRLDVAFFNANGYISVITFVAAVAGLWY
jgi:excisionase family DNA binding protein